MINDIHYLAITLQICIEILSVGHVVSVSGTFCTFVFRQGRH